MNAPTISSSYNAFLNFDNERATNKWLAYLAISPIKSYKAINDKGLIG